MKKLFAVVLTLVMLFAVCVPAFATTITDQSASQEATADIYTSTETPDDFKAYTVTIPASLEIPWSSEKTAFTYGIKTQLEMGKRLQILVGCVGDQKLTNANTSIVLPYTFSNSNDEGLENLSYTTSREVVTTNRTFNIDISEEDWNKAPVARYADILTFTIAVIDAEPATP